MALQNFEPGARIYSPKSALSEAPQHVDPELRAMALGIQAWFDGAKASRSASVLVEQPLPAQRFREQSRASTKRSSHQTKQ